MAKKTKRRAVSSARVSGKRPRAVVPKVKELLALARSGKDARLEQAVIAWKMLPHAAKMQACEELVTTRSAEIRAAYKDVIGLGYGPRTTYSSAQLGKKTGRAKPPRRARGGTPTFTRFEREIFAEEVVISLLVRRKVRSGDALPARSRPIPKYFLGYAQQGEQRVLCAIPTDIEDGRYYRAVPNAGVSRSFVVVQSPTIAPERGVITCVARDESTNKQYAMSCHHVLALSKSTRPTGSVALNARCFERTGAGTPGRLICTLSTRYGRIVPGTVGFSLDAALGEIQDADALRSVLGDTPLAAILSDSNALPPVARVITPHGVAMVKFAGSWGQFDRIEYGVHPSPMHETVVEWQVVAGVGLVGGHSGSPVLHPTEPILLGMHIAGVEEGNRCFMIPASHLFQFWRYGGRSQLTLVG